MKATDLVGTDVLLSWITSDKQITGVRRAARIECGDMTAWMVEVSYTFGSDSLPAVYQVTEDRCVDTKSSWDTMIAHCESNGMSVTNI